MAVARMGTVGATSFFLYCWNGTATRRNRAVASCRVVKQPI